MLDILLDSLLDSVKLVPFLFLTYLFMEFLEHRAGSAASDRIRTAGKLGPLWGGLLGVIPQCGFSTAASSLFAGRIITIGTLLAVYLSTSDEMLPIMISNAVPVGTILKILAVKAAIGIVTGFLMDFLYISVMKKQKTEVNVHKICENEHCHCERGIVKSALMHTVKILIYVSLISLLLNGMIEAVGEDTLSNLFMNIPVLGEMISALVGLIPNCASSVVITQLYLDQIIGAGAMMSGLLVNAGVGLLVLFRLNRDKKQNAVIVGILYISGVFWGVLLELMGIVF